jgi:hypothetical protein
VTSNKQLIFMSMICGGLFQLKRFARDGRPSGEINP